MRRWGLLALAGCPVLYAGESPRFFKQSEMIPERGLVTSYVLRLQTNQFVFLAPPHWQVKCELNEKKILLTPRDQRGTITVRVLAGGGEFKVPLQVDPLREEVTGRFPGATLLRERACFVNDKPGWAFDLEQFAANQTKLHMTLAFAPYGGGVVEFMLRTEAKKYEDCKRAFSNVMISFRSEPCRLEK